jgi:hypothetical protein
LRVKLFFGMNSVARGKIFKSSIPIAFPIAALFTQDDVNINEKLPSFSLTISVRRTVEFSAQ